MNEENNIAPINEELNVVKYETKNVNKAMKRNIERFPEDFCFQLTIKGVKRNVVPKWNHI